MTVHSPRPGRAAPAKPPGKASTLSPGRAKATAARRRGLRLKYVTRIEQPDRRTFGWQVRVVAGGRVAASAFFPDATHGSHGRALAAALALRDAAERELGLPVTRRTVHTVARSNTGVLGVHWSAHLNAYVATYPVGLRRYARELFPPAKDTAKAHKAALAAATRARAEGVRAYHGA